MFYIVDMKEAAKKRLSGEWGSGILYSLGPTFIMSIVTLTTSSVFTPLVEGDSVLNIVLLITWLVLILLLGAITSFMSVNLVVKFTRYDEKIDFFLGWKPLKSFARYCGFQVLFGIVVLLVFSLVLITFFSSEIKMLLVDFDSITENDIFDMFFSFAAVYFITFIVVLVLQIKFMFVPQIIAHEEKGIFEAITDSWQLTKGNFFRLIGFYLSFTGWYILAQITYGLGLLYFMPYFTVSKVELYFALINYQVDEAKKQEETEEVLIEEEEQSTQEEDPFDV